MNQPEKPTFRQIWRQYRRPILMLAVVLAVALIALLSLVLPREQATAFSLHGRVTQVAAGTITIQEDLPFVLSPRVIVDISPGVIIQDQRVVSNRPGLQPGQRVRIRFDAITRGETPRVRAVEIVILS